MKSAIVQKARELGFDACRFTTAEPPASAPHFQSWLTAGHHGEMDYLARNADRRVNPLDILPKARSIIALAVSYGEIRGLGSEAHATGRFEAPPESADLTHAPHVTQNGLIARYARHADYHDTLAGPLKQLAIFVNQIGGPGTKSVWYVDTGPVLERDVAQRAGLGFIGKHTNVISRQFGNWIFLAEILTTLELEPDTAEQNRCGSCTRCLGACPTGALVAPFKLDARLCISYLTIELKGSIPVELRARIGNRIFGCDDCLAACPWNRFAQEGRLMKESARPELAEPDLIELLKLDDAAFKARFAGTPMLRSKRRGLLRNVCVALGNSGNPADLPALRNALNDPESLVREHAAWAIDRILDRPAAAT